MPFILLVVSVIVIGLGSGIGSAYWVIRDGALFNTMRIGPWTAYPDASGIEADPYTRAHQINRRMLPVTGFDSIDFETKTDSQGAALDGRCHYRLTGPMPPARFWTLAVTRPDGRPIANPAGRHAFASPELLRAEDGRAEIVLSSSARPGNWLPIAPGPLALVLTLYDTTIGSGVGDDMVLLPDIRREGCP